MVLDLADRDIATCWAYLAEEREAQERAERDAERERVLAEQQQQAMEIARGLKRR